MTVATPPLWKRSPPSFPATPLFFKIWLEAQPPPCRNPPPLCSGLPQLFWSEIFRSPLKLGELLPCVIVWPYLCLSQRLWSVMKSFSPRDSMKNLLFPNKNYSFNVHISRNMIKMQQCCFFYLKHVTFHIFLSFQNFQWTGTIGANCLLSFIH